jgi:hypothetical protein
VFAKPCEEPPRVSKTSEDPPCVFVVPSEDLPCFLQNPLKTHHVFCNTFRRPSRCVLLYLQKTLKVFCNRRPSLCSVASSEDLCTCNTIRSPPCFPQYPPKTPHVFCNTFRRPSRCYVTTSEDPPFVQ